MNTTELKKLLDDSRFDVTLFDGYPSSSVISSIKDLLGTDLEEIVANPRLKDNLLVLLTYLLIQSDNDNMRKDTKVGFRFDKDLTSRLRELNVLESGRSLP